MKLAIVFAVITAFVLGAYSVVNHASALTTEQVNSELSALGTSVDQLTTADLAKQSADLDNIKKDLHKDIEKISSELDKDRVDASLKMIKSMFHGLEDQLTESALNGLKSTMPTTTAAINTMEE